MLQKYLYLVDVLSQFGIEARLLTVTALCVGAICVLGVSASETPLPKHNQAIGGLRVERNAGPMHRLGVSRREPFETLDRYEQRMRERGDAGSGRDPDQ